MTDEPADDDPDYRVSKALALRLGPRDLDQRVGADGDLSGLDKQLLKVAARHNGRISPKDLAEEVGFDITPARAAQRLREILNTMDWITIEQQIALVMHDMVDLKIYLQDKLDQDKGGSVYNRDGDEIAYSLGDPRWTANLTKVLKMIGDQHDKAFARRKDAQTKISSGHALTMTSAIDRALSRFLFIMMELYPEIEETIARDAMEDALTEAFKVVDENTLD